MNNQIAIIRDESPILEAELIEQDGVKAQSRTVVAAKGPIDKYNNLINCIISDKKRLARLSETIKKNERRAKEMKRLMDRLEEV